MKVRHYKIYYDLPIESVKHIKVTDFMNNSDRKIHFLWQKPETEEISKIMS